MRRKTGKTATPPSDIQALNAAAKAHLDDSASREAIARLACSGPGLALLHAAHAALQPDSADKLNELIGLLEAAASALESGGAWTSRNDGMLLTKATFEGTIYTAVSWWEISEILSLFVARADGLSALSMLVARSARPVTERHLIAVTDRAESIALVRQPAYMTVATLSELEVIAVDGEPFVTAGPEAGLLSSYRARPRAPQRGLPFAGPRRMNEHLIGSPVVRALQAFPLTGDERSPIRGDTLRLAGLGYAVTGPMLLDEPTGALLFGANTEANRKRFWGTRRGFITIWNSQTRKRGGT